MGEYILTDLPGVNINTTSLELLRVIQAPFIIVVNDKNNYVGYIDRKKALPLLQPEPKPDISLITTLINSLTVGIVAIDLKGIVIVANPTALDILNLKTRDLIGIPISTAIPQSSLLEVLSSGTPQVVKIKINEKTFFAAQSLILSDGTACGCGIRVPEYLQP